MINPTRVMKSVITGFTGNIGVFKHRDPTESVVVSVVHLNQKVAVSRTYVVRRDGTVYPIAESNPLGKDHDVYPVVFDNGTLWVVVSEAETVPLSSGSTNSINIYEYAGAFKPSMTNSSVDQVARDAAAKAGTLASSAYSKITELVTKVSSIRV